MKDSIDFGRGNILRYKKYDSGYFNQQAALEIIKSSLDDYIRTVGWYDQKPVAMGVGLIGRVSPTMTAMASATTVNGKTTVLAALP